MSRLARICSVALLFTSIGMGGDSESAAGKESLVSEENLTLQLRDVEVTAQKRPESLQKAPLSVTVVNRADLDDAGSLTLEDALWLAPNFSTVDLGLRRIFLPYARGVGAGQGTPAITTYIDGVAQFYQDTGNIALHDVERIEFVRGPQSVLYGRNALGGAINVVTRKPAEAWTGEASLVTGSDDLLNFILAQRGPLIDEQLFVNLSLGLDSRDGYITNRYDGDDVGDRRGRHGRMGITWIPAPDWTLDLSISAEQNRDGGYSLAPLDRLRRHPHTVDTDDPGFADRDFMQTALRMDAELDTIRFRSISGYLYSRSDESLDTDFSALPIIRGVAQADIHAFSQILEFGSLADLPMPLTDGLTLDWLLGAAVSYSLADRRDYTDLLPMAIDFGIAPVSGRFITDAEVDVLTLGLYGQATLHLGDRWHLTLGIRGEYEESEADIERSSIPPFGPVEYQKLEGDWSAILPHLNLAYDLSQDVMLYGAISRGYRPGGFNLVSAVGAEVYDQETLWSLEFGTKTQWLDRRLRVNAAIFFTDWRDMQQQLIDPVTQRPYVQNAAEASSYGFELELLARLAAHTTLSVNLGYTHIRYDEFASPLNGDASGNAVLLVPDYTWLTALRQSIPLTNDLELYGRVAVSGVGQRYFDPGEVEGQVPYATCDLAVGFRNDREHWQVEIWVQNLTDEDYIVTAFQHALAPYVGANGPPRTVGISASLTW